MKNFIDIREILKKIYFYFCISKFNFFFKKKKIFQKNNFTQLKKILHNKRIALVGNSPKILKSKNQIDSYDIVIRINLLPRKKDYEKIGKRCDIMMLSTGPISLINENFIKIYMTDINRHYINYAFGKCYSYPLDWLLDIKRKYNFRPTTGAKALDFLCKILDDPDITLFGFTHEPYAWHHGKNSEFEIKRSYELHNYQAEKKFFSMLVKNKIKYHF